MGRKVDGVQLHGVNNAACPAVQPQLNSHPKHSDTPSLERWGDFHFTTDDRPLWEPPSCSSQKGKSKLRSFFLFLFFCSVLDVDVLYVQNVTPELFIPTLPRQNRFGSFAVETRDATV